MNIGFRQYRLPNNISMQQLITINNNSYVDNEHALKNAVDGHKTTYCQLNASDGLLLKNAQIIVTFDKKYLCNYLQLIFHNNIKKIKMYDYSDGSQGALMLSYNGKSKIIENVVDKEISAILLTDFEPIENDSKIQITEINIFNNIIEAPQGYYIKDMEIQSKLKEER